MRFQLSSSEKARKKTFKRSVNLDDGRRRREETTLQIRKSKKDARLAKRRQLFISNADIGVVNTTPSGTDRLSKTMDSTAIPTRLVQGVWGADLSTQLECTTHIRKLLCVEKDPPIQQVVDSGVIPRFLAFLQRNDAPALQFEAVWALTNILSGTNDHATVVVDAGALPLLVQLLSNPNVDVCEQATWALGNIAGDSTPHRDSVLHAGAVQPLLRQLLSSSLAPSVERNTIWTLSKLCRGKPKVDFNIIQPALPFLAYYIKSDDHEILADTCWALSYSSDGDNEDIQAVIDTNVVPSIVDLLQNPSLQVQTPALRVIGNIASGEDDHTQLVIDNNALPNLLKLLSSPRKVTVKEACWVFSNITAGNERQIQAVIESKAIPHLIQILEHAEFHIRKEAAWAIANAATNGSHDQVRFLVQQGCIRPLCDFLTMKDANMITMVLDGLETILKVGEEESNQMGSQNPMATFIAEAEGLAKIEELQNHANDDVYKQCVRILEKHFGAEEDEEDMAVIPAIDKDDNRFAFS